jgi:hypothetical protein
MDGGVAAVCVFSVAPVGDGEREHHDERDDRRPGVNRQLPEVRVAGERSDDRPSDDDRDRGGERRGMLGRDGDRDGEPLEPAGHAAFGTMSSTFAGGT